MESSEFLLTETVFQRVSNRGGISALLTAKEKLKTLIMGGATIAESAENPSSWLVKRIRTPPNIYSIEVNQWLLMAAREVLLEHTPDFAFLTTTDYANHVLGPEDERSIENIHCIDSLLGDIMNISSNPEIVVTADHGMNSKTQALDLSRILKDGGIGAQVIHIIKDRYVAHHQNLGGSAYIYLDNLSALNETMALLREKEGVEVVLTSTDAAKKYHLHPHRIGHIFVLAEADTVFGVLPSAKEEVSLRSHGSMHEIDIPIYAFGSGPMSIMPESNCEVAAWIS